VVMRVRFFDCDVRRVQEETGMSIFHDNLLWFSVSAHAVFPVSILAGHAKTLCTHTLQRFFDKSFFRFYIFIHLYSPETVENNEKKEKNTQKQTALQNIQISDITHSGDCR